MADKQTTSGWGGWGTPPYVYDLDSDWPRLPNGWVLEDVGGVAVDEADKVYVFHRGDHPMIVFDREGQVLDSWGDGVFNRPHGVDVGPDGSVYCTDDGDHTVRKCAPDGTVLMTIGIPGAPAPAMSGAPFNRCTHTALSPDGEIYVSDGYANARVHKFTAQGELMFRWGSPGSGPSQFDLPHNICTDDQGRVIVADRENDRIQVFDASGVLLDTWIGLRRPCALCRAQKGQAGVVVGELGRGPGGAPPSAVIGAHSFYVEAGRGGRSSSGRALRSQGVAPIARTDVMFVGENRADPAPVADPAPALESSPSGDPAGDPSRRLFVSHDGRISADHP